MPPIQTRSRFTNKEKLGILARQSQLRLSNKLMAQEVGCCEGTIRRWKACAAALIRSKPKNISVHTGRKPEHQELEARLLEEIDKWMLYGVPLNQQDIIRMARAIMPNFKDGNLSRMSTWVSTFLAREKIVLRRVTQHGLQQPSNIEAARLDFIDKFMHMREEGGYQEDQILNIDQTGVFFENPRSTTLAHRGARQAPIITNKLSVRATAMMTISMSGKKLRPYVVFKGTRGPRSRIARKLDELPADCIYSIQPNAWIDVCEMEKYTDSVLGPYIRQFAGRRCLLILDRFSVHQCDRVQQKLTSLGFDLLFIPSGMTGILQPLDIAVNKPFKDHLKSLYTQWLISQTDTENLLLKRPKPTRIHVANWIHESWDAIQHRTIVQAFHYLQEEAPPTIVPTEHGLHALSLAAALLL